MSGGSHSHLDRYWRHIAVAAAILRDARGRVVLVRSRYPSGRVEWQLPGGILDPGETLFASAAREVEEEAGLVVTEWAGFAYTVHRVLVPVEIDLIVQVFAAASWGGDMRPCDPEGIVDAVELVEVDRVRELMPDAAFHVPLLEWLNDRIPRLHEFVSDSHGASRVVSFGESAHSQPPGRSL